ncbi:iodotyrosine deiodinase [Cochliomyia hominivorax]
MRLNVRRKFVSAPTRHILYIVIIVNLLYTFLRLKFPPSTNLSDQIKTGEQPNDVDDNEEYVPALDENEHVPYEGATITLPGGAQQFYEMIKNRRSVRSFKPQPIPSLDVIKTCILAAGTSPSGAHTEPWTFCIVTCNEVKKRIREIIEYEEELNYKQRMSRQWTMDLRPLKTNHIKPYLTDAPYLILIFKQIYGFNKFGKRKQHYYNEISVSIATGILLSAFQAAGLSSLITTPLNCGPALRNLLNRPKNEKLLVLMPVGYPADDCRIPDLQRKNLNDIVAIY